MHEISADAAPVILENQNTRATTRAAMLEQPPAIFREGDDVLARAGQPDRLNQSLLTEMAQVARARIERPLVLVSEITTGDHSKGTHGGERPRLGPAERVLAIPIANELAFGSTRQVQVSCEDLPRVASAVPFGPSRKAFRLRRVAHIPPSTEGAALFAAPDRGSDQRRSGTQDVNDPAPGPAMRPRGPIGVVHVLGSACGVLVEIAGGLHRIVGGGRP